MPQNLTDSSTFTDPIQVPAGSDAAGLTYLLTAFQGLANRTRYLLEGPTFYRLKSVQVFSASGTWNKPAGIRAVQVMVWGAGGGSGGATGGAGAARGGGGGGGGFSMKWVTAPGSSESVTVGTGGTAGASTPTAGGNGGSSSFGAHASATGGSGGAVGTNSTTTGFLTTTGGAGGAGSGGDVNIAGQGGGHGVVSQSSTAIPSADGGAAPMGIGVRAEASGSVNAVAGASPGGGASGPGTTASNKAGAAGANGLVVVYEYA